MRAVYSRHPLSRDLKEAFRSSALFRRRSPPQDLTYSLLPGRPAVAYTAPMETSRMRAEFDLLAHRDPTGSFFQPHKCQHNHVLEFTEVIAASHYLYNIEEILARVSTFNRRPRRFTSHVIPAYWRAK